MALTLASFRQRLLSKVFEKSLKIGTKNLRKSLDIFGLGDYEPCLKLAKGSETFFELAGLRFCISSVTYVNN
jgi:hypothetical protein